MTHHTNHAPSTSWQRVLNQTWPQHDQHGHHARDIDLHTENTPARARLLWADDGWQILPGRITRRANGCVYVEINDPRMMIAGVWLAERHTQPDT